MPLQKGRSGRAEQLGRKCVFLALDGIRSLAPEPRTRRALRDSARALGDVRASIGLAAHFS